MKFIHGADLHFDRSFEGLTMIPETFQPYLAVANQEMLKNIVAVALDKQVDFVLLAGDTFHQNRPSLKAQQFFFQQMERLAVAKIPVYMNFGNHDYYEAQRYWFDFPQNIHLFTSEAVETKYLTTKQQETVAITSFSFQAPMIEQEKALEFPERSAVDFQIGMYHGGQSPYAPLSVSQLVEKGYDYWALGHIHVPQVLAKQPPVIYPGTPLGHTKKETDVAGITYVSGEKNALALEWLPVAPLKWLKKTVSLAGIRQPYQVIPRVVEALNSETTSLMEVTLTDSQLGTELEYQIESDELRQAIQAKLPAQLFLFKLTAHSAVKERPYLGVEPQLVDQLLATYEEPAIFNELLSDLVKNPELHAQVVKESFKAEVLAQVKESIHTHYRFKEAFDADQKS